MAKTLEKTRKRIAKKHNGVIDALHEKSRDSRRLHKAQVRDERLEKLAGARRKRDKPLRPSLSSLFPANSTDLNTSGARLLLPQSGHRGFRQPATTHSGEDSGRDQEVRQS